MEIVRIVTSEAFCLCKMHLLLKKQSFCTLMQKLCFFNELLLCYKQLEECIMIETHELKNRNRYLDKLIGFQDTEPVKVITGIRRCGKSSLLKLMVGHLKETGKSDDQIIEMDFERYLRPICVLAVCPELQI